MELSRYRCAVVGVVAGAAALTLVGCASDARADCYGVGGGVDWGGSVAYGVTYSHGTACEPACAPVACAPVVCEPVVCAPAVCAPAPVVCAPVYRPVCGPAPICAPPPRCETSFGVTIRLDDGPECRARGRGWSGSHGGGKGNHAWKRSGGGGRGGKSGSPHRSGGGGHKGKGGGGGHSGGRDAKGAHSGGGNKGRHGRKGGGGKGKKRGR